jgi:protein-L-isoaspartate(D-aspartate) O-methyltransferase
VQSSTYKTNGLKRRYKGFMRMQDKAAFRTNMVNCQILTNNVTDRRVSEALLTVPREEFVPRSHQGVAYIDEDLPLGNDRYLMEPMAFAKLLQALAVTDSDIVLDIACASGYSTAVLGRLAATVVGLEDNEDIAEATNQRLTNMGVENAVVVSGPLHEGYAAQAPYDAIFFNGAVEIDLERITAQLADAGRMIVVERNGPIGVAVIYCKIDGRINRIEAFDAQLPVLPGFERIAEFQF